MNDTVEIEPSALRVNSLPSNMSPHKHEYAETNSSHIKALPIRNSMITPTIEESDDEKEADVTDHDAEPAIVAFPVNESASIKFESFRLV